MALAWCRLLNVYANCMCKLVFFAMPPDPFSNRLSPLEFETGKRKAIEVALGLI
jgi:hypothetical protein